ncbi:MAG: Txe/YoeB family addiction module toxin [Gammaproteobacteria bacterium]|nr:Txe/YoeB family addiction module toxin [Gammaproteobacteria bacterium]
MKIIYTIRAQEDLTYWQKNSTKKVARIEALLNDIQVNSYTGLGKPEPLRFEKVCYWSRRIDQEHRLIYKIHEACIYVAQCRYHYKK